MARYNAARRSPLRLKPAPRTRSTQARVGAVALVALGFVALALLVGVDAVGALRALAILIACGLFAVGVRLWRG